MLENGELVGVGGVVVALITAITRMKPATDKIKLEGDQSLRADLLKRIESLEDDQRQDREKHESTVNSMRESHDNIVRVIRTEYETIISGMREEHRRVCAEYESKLETFQAKVDRLLDMLMNKETK